MPRRITISSRSSAAVIGNLRMRRSSFCRTYVVKLPILSRQQMNCHREWPKLDSFDVDASATMRL